MQDALPRPSRAQQAWASDLIMTALAAVEESLSETPRTEAEIGTYAWAMADMFCSYLERLS